MSNFTVALIKHLACKAYKVLKYGSGDTASEIVKNSYWSHCNSLEEVNEPASDALSPSSGAVKCSESD